MTSTQNADVTLSQNSRRFLGDPPIRWKGGDITITKVVENTSMPLTSFLSDADYETVRDVPWLGWGFFADEGIALMSFHSFLIETPPRDGAG